MLLDTVSVEENEKAKEFVKAHLSPATYSDNSTVKFPDGTFGETLAYSKTFSIDVKPGTGGDLFVYILPYVEVPLATWTASGGWSFYYDPNMQRKTSDRSWMADQGIEAFRCLGQSCTAYNTTAEIYKQGNVNAAVLRSCLDRHRRSELRAATDPYVAMYTQDCVLIDGLPMTIPAITSNSKHPYIGEASRGCYVVNRNFAGFKWIFRNGRDKAEVNEFFANTATAAKQTSFASIPIFPRSPDTELDINASQKNFDYPGNEVTTTGVYPSKTIAWDHSGVLTGGLGISGFNGNGYGVGVMGFTGLSEQSSFTLKFKHMYEFMLKPGSPFTPLTTPSWPRVDWVEEIIRKQLIDKQEAFDSSANFLGAILRGLQTIWPVVRPLVVKGATKLLEWVDGRAKKAKPPPPKTKPKLKK